MKTTTSIRTLAAACCILGAVSARAEIINFDGLPLGNPGSDGSTAYTGPGGGYYWNGSNNAGSFVAGSGAVNATFDNAFVDYGGGFSSWDGFSYSNTTDTATTGYDNQYSAAAGSGAGGSSTYVVGFQPYSGEWAINFSSPVSLIGGGLSLTNTTYAYLSMLNGDSFSKKFGGATGTDADWFKLTITGWDGATSLGSVDFYLADFRFTNSAQDYILNSWSNVDLSSLGGNVSKLSFSLSSSDNGAFGMNTPAYFAMDNLVAFAAVPEPATMAALVGLFPLAVALRRRMMSRK